MRATMAKAPKYFCAHCDGKMPVGVSFCPSCAYPTEWCSYDDRVQWEVLQYRKQREGRGASNGHAPSPAATPAAGSPLTAPSYRTMSSTKKPVTAKIKPMFGAAAIAAGEEAPRSRIRRPKVEAKAPSAPEPVPEPAQPAPLALVPTEPEPMAAAVEDPPVEQVPHAEPQRAEPPEPVRAKPVVSKPIAAKHQPAAPSARLHPEAVPHIEVSETDTPRPTVQMYLGDMVGLLEQLNERVEVLEARLREIYEEMAARSRAAKPKRRRLFGR